MLLMLQAPSAPRAEEPAEPRLALKDVERKPADDQHEAAPSAVVGSVPEKQPEAPAVLLETLEKLSLSC